MHRLDVNAPSVDLSSLIGGFGVFAAQDTAVRRKTCCNRGRVRILWLKHRSETSRGDAPTTAYQRQCSSLQQSSRILARARRATDQIYHRGKQGAVASAPLATWRTASCPGRWHRKRAQSRSALCGRCFLRRTGDAATPDQLAGWLRVGPADLDLDKPAPEHVLTKVTQWHMSVGFAQAMISLFLDFPIEGSIRLRSRHTVQLGVGHRHVVGMPEQFADAIDLRSTKGAADGSNIIYDVYASRFQSFVNHVIPILEQRRVFGKEYGDKTLRRRCGLIRRPSIHEQKQKRRSIA